MNNSESGGESDKIKRKPLLENSEKRRQKINQKTIRERERDRQTEIEREKEKGG